MTFSNKSREYKPVLYKYRNTLLTPTANDCITEEASLAGPTLNAFNCKNVSPIFILQMIIKFHNNLENGNLRQCCFSSTPFPRRNAVTP